MTERHLISREIGIDAGHRVTFHGSKCRNLHGHRYKIEAWCIGPLAQQGEEEGMVLDFGFLKEEMMQCIDVPCDHGLILWYKDPLLSLLMGGAADFVHTFMDAKKNGGAYLTEASCGKLYLVPFMPTAENLARHWYEILYSQIVRRSNGRARLDRIRVWETPNCAAEYPVPAASPLIADHSERNG